MPRAQRRKKVANTFFKCTQQSVRNNQEDLLNNNIIFNKLIKSSGKRNPKIKLIFLLPSISTIVKSGWKKYFLQI